MELQFEVEFSKCNIILAYEARYGRSFTLLSYLEVLNYLLVAGVSVYVFVYEPFLNCNI